MNFSIHTYSKNENRFLCKKTTRKHFCLRAAKFKARNYSSAKYLMVLTIWLV